MVTPVTHRPTAESFRAVLGHFASGVVVVTAPGATGPVGMTCQSFSSLSLDPPLVVFSPAKTSTTYPAIRQSGRFCINILAEDQQHLCGAFARSGADKWQGVDWTPSANGSPQLDNALAWIDCALETEHDAGDHYITIGRVLELSGSSRSPLLYFKGSFGRLERVGSS